jgi:hypothetical protein
MQPEISAAVSSPLVEQFVDNNLPSIDWAYIATTKQLTSAQIKKYHRFLDWDLVVRYQALDRDLVCTFAAYIDFSQISITQPRLSSEDIIAGYKAQLATLD